MSTDLDFFYACSNGDSARVEQILSKKPELLNQTFGSGFTGLMLAATHERTETLRLLLSKKEVDLSIQSEYGYTVITEATSFNSFFCLKLLLLHPKCSKAIVEMKNRFGETAEMIAKSKEYKMCEKLLKSF